MERRNAMPEGGIFDGELYDGELPPGQEDRDDLPPGVHIVTDKEAFDAERRFKANTGREHARADGKLVTAMKDASGKMRASSDPLGTAARLLHTPETNPSSPKPPRIADEQIGYSDKAKRNALRQKRADEGRRN